MTTKIAAQITAVTRISSSSATIQPMILPSRIDSPHLGIVTATIRSPVTGPLRHGLDRIHDPLRARHVEVLENGTGVCGAVTISMGARNAPRPVPWSHASERS
jgi:hypothetical protein